MKSPTVLQCDQCESETGNLIASELDITYCSKIENARGRLVCTYRETKPPPKPETQEDTNKEDTKDTTEPPVVKEDPEDNNDPDDTTKDTNEQKDNNDDIKDLDEVAKDAEDQKDNEETKDKDKKEDDDDDDDQKKTEDKPDQEDNPLIKPPIADDTPLPEKQDGVVNGDYTDEFEHPTDGLPAGSFRKHCTGCELLQQGKLLACDFCKRNNGNERYTIAIVGDCKFFVCIDGTLRCDKIHSARL